ncbi:MAG: hypothetical protein IJT77_11210, partial [Clostridia bacterium]|nr:hypothetical protein [Clostridia bacterium]
TVASITSDLQKCKLFFLLFCAGGRHMPSIQKGVFYMPDVYALCGENPLRDFFADFVDLLITQKHPEQNRQACNHKKANGYAADPKSGRRKHRDHRCSHR